MTSKIENSEDQLIRTILEFFLSVSIESDCDRASTRIEVVRCCLGCLRFCVVLFACIIRNIQKEMAAPGVSDSRRRRRFDDFDFDLGVAFLSCRWFASFQRIIPKIFNEEGGAHEEKGEHARLVCPECTVHCSAAQCARLRMLFLTGWVCVFSRSCAVVFHWSNRCGRSRENHSRSERNGMYWLTASDRCDVRIGATHFCGDGCGVVLRC